MHLQKIRDILSRHKMVENMVHVQTMPRHEMVQTLVQRQHLAELKNLIEPMSPEEIALILEALDKDAAGVVWSQIPDELANNVLWEVSDSCREQLVVTSHDRFEPATHAIQG